MTDNEKLYFQNERDDFPRQVPADAPAKVIDTSGELTVPFAKVSLYEECKIWNGHAWIEGVRCSPPKIYVFMVKVEVPAHVDAESIRKRLLNSPRDGMISIAASLYVEMNRDQ